MDKGEKFLLKLAILIIGVCYVFGNLGSFLEKKSYNKKAKASYPSRNVPILPNDFSKDTHNKQLILPRNHKQDQIDDAVDDAVDRNKD